MDASVPLRSPPQLSSTLLLLNLTSLNILLDLYSALEAGNSMRTANNHHPMLYQEHGGELLIDLYCLQNGEVLAQDTRNTTGGAKLTGP